jgi:catechol 2,3-dioxygenase-like lactoylglutathione lyase family enzyme
MEKSIRFYKDGLGFKNNEKSYNPPVIFFDTDGGTKFELFPIDELTKDIGKNCVVKSEGFSDVTLAYNVKIKEEVEQIVALASEAGAKILKKPQDVFWGGYHAYFADPDGYIWEIAYGPDFKFDENNMLLF